jgi:uncharacterized protein (UPF0335 family)
MSDAFSGSPMAGAVKQIEQQKASFHTKEDTEVAQKGDNTKTLRSILDRILRLEEEKRATADAIKDIYQEVKSAGYEPKAVRIIVRRELETAEQKAARVSVEESVELIEAALGAFVDSPLGAAAVARSSLSNNRWRSTTLETAPIEWLRAFHQGWVDAQNRNGWPRGYDDASKMQQIAYEQGRLQVVNIIAAGMPVPGWRGDRAGVEPVRVSEIKAIGLIGSPIPPEFKEESAG